MEETRKVWEFAEAFKQQHPTLNVLVGVDHFLWSVLISGDLTLFSFCFVFFGRLTTLGVWCTTERRIQRDWRRTLQQTLWVRPHFSVEKRHRTGHRVKSTALSDLGVFILTESLIPLLQKSRDPRVVGLHTHTHTSLYFYLCGAFHRYNTLPRSLP